MHAGKPKNRPRNTYNGAGFKSLFPDPQMLLIGTAIFSRRVGFSERNFSLLLCHTFLN